MNEQHFYCPFCGELISLMVDMSVPKQSYIEDCEVCCRPISVSVLVAEREIEQFVAERSD